MATRRAFVSCASHLALAASLAPRAALGAWARRAAGPVVAEEPFGRLEQVADGVWALISTPLTGDRTTLSNGGLVAGRNGVLAIEGFMTPEGAKWLAGQSKALTGQWPTHVAVTHYHADHANGVAGYNVAGERCKAHATAKTRDDVLARNLPADDARSAALRDAELVNERGESSLDLGGRVVHLVPRQGHTASDITIEVDEPSVVFCGDLVWNGMFPNYVDASPSRLAQSVVALRRSRATAYVPGHGSVAGEGDVARYMAVLEEVERAAREARAKGVTAQEAGAGFSLPASLGEWTLFSKAFHERAFAAWFRELP